MNDYVELHCHSNFSLLDGASHPEELVSAAGDIAMPALALTDHDGLYGAIRFYKAARASGIKPVIGVELTLDGGQHITLLAKDSTGYSNLCRMVTKSHLDNSKGSPSIAFSSLAEKSGGIICLSGCRKGEVASLILDGKPGQAEEAAKRYRDVFGQDYYIEVQNNLCPGDERLCSSLISLAECLGIRCVATNNAHYARRDAHRLQDILVCIRNRATLERSGGVRRPNSEFYLKPAAEISPLFRAYPEALRNSLHIADKCNVDLNFSSYRFPDFAVPDGETADSYLAKLCHGKARERYGKPSERVASQINYELNLISKMNLSGYFLIVWDIMDYAKKNGIPAQGRGSAANSVVAYVLGITRVDPIRHNLFFGRFINEEMSSIPDIDIDVSTNHRERLIQYIYRKYGEEHAAMACTYVTFRPRNAIREVGKALGMPEGILDRMSKAVICYSAQDIDDDLKALDEFRPYLNSEAWEHFIRSCREITDFPRHLSIHVGGMIISSCPLVDIVPLEKAAMPGRVVCQWDKDGIEDAGLVKVDILGLRMLSLIDEAAALVKRNHDAGFDIERIPQDDGKVYDMICRADTLGVFQVESRAQMQTLPRTKPRSIEDLTVEVAIIRPGPLQGNMVHPYINRRQGKEKVSYMHPRLKPILEETLGVILFQEQVLKCAIAIAGFSPGEADSLRRAMSRKRSQQAMEQLKKRFLDGARGNGVGQAVALRIFDTLKGFAEYGFCKSHAAGFALLAYQSAWLKCYYPSEFYAALLNNQPMGFYSPHVIVGDARRHGVKVLPVDINRSRGKCIVEGGNVRLGFRYVKSVGETAIVDLEQQQANKPFSSLEDVYLRTGLSRDALQNLVMAGAMDGFGKSRRQLLWDLGLLEQRGREGLPMVYACTEVALPAMTRVEEISAEYDMQGLSTGSHPMELFRERVPAGVLKTAEAASLPAGSNVTVAGYVVCHQMPATSKGHVFLTIEDEEGLMNIVIRPDVYEKYRYVERTEPLMLIRGQVQKRDGVINIIASHLEPLNVIPTSS